MLILENVPLAPMTTLRVGGPARYFYEAHNEQEIRDALVFARERGLPVFVMGGGSNLVVSDAGFAGLVLKVALLGIRQRSLGKGLTRFDVAAGEDWDGFVARHRAIAFRRFGVPEWHSRHSGRHAGAECRRLRPGS